MYYSSFKSTLLEVQRFYRDSSEYKDSSALLEVQNIYR